MKAYSLIYRTLTLMLSLALVVSACTKDEKYLFEGNSATRIERSIEELRNKLASSEEGWILEYIPSIGQHFGGYIIHLKFDKEGYATISNEIMPYGDGVESYRSMYFLRSDKGAVLSFSVYNQGYHIFADPDVEGGWGRGRGFEGDYELVSQYSTSSDTLYFKGKITGNAMRMFKPSQGPKTYLESVRKIRKSALNINELLTNNTDAWVGSIGGKSVILHFDTGDYNRFLVDHGDGFLQPIPYIYTEAGVRLLTAINGVSLLSWDPQAKTWSTPSNETLALRKDPYYPQYTKYLGTYTLHNLYTADGTKLDPVEVEFQESKGLTYTITPKDNSYMKYSLTAVYNKERDAFMIMTQPITIPGDHEGYILMPFNAKGGKEFLQTFMASAGQISSLDPNHANKAEGDVYVMVDNGAWRRDLVRSFVIVKMFLGNYQVATNVKPALLDKIYFVKHKP